MELFLFYKNLDETIKIAHQNVDTVIIDWENQGKYTRQLSYNTQINEHTLTDLMAFRLVFRKKIICRINGGNQISEKEIKSAIDSGANEILLPMVQRPDEVAKVLKIINGQCPLGILVETNKAVTCIKELVKFPLSRIYFGLNDFAIDNKNNNIFLPVATKIVEHVRMECKHIPFGFGGLTHPSLGSPLPCLSLLKEMARLNCNFTFLRRSFYKSLNQYPVETIVKDIQSSWQSSLKRDARAVENDFQEFKNAILFQTKQTHADTHSSLRQQSH